MHFNFKFFLHKNSSILFFVFFISSIFLINNYAYVFNKYFYANHFSNMHIHYIDVGQGDSILIQVNNKNMLIDSGPVSAKNDLIKYLDKNHIYKLDYVIATHPHEDHIGNMADIITRYKILEFYAPKVSSESKCFEDLIYSLKSKNLKIHTITASTNSIDLGPDTHITFLSPQPKQYDNLNNYSAVFKITYKNNSFLFTGDAEESAEKEILSSYDNICCDVIKIGHHGSQSSTHENFLSSVNPSVAIICVGLYNDYNHPHKTTIDKLLNINCAIYRTDKDGTIHLVSNGTKIKRI